MTSLLRFLVFVAVVSAAVALLYLWRSAAPVVATPPADAPVAVTSRLPGLAALDREFTELVSSVVPSVVSINVTPAQALDPRARLLHSLLGRNRSADVQPQLGSGAIISEDGYIVTNWHVITNAGAIDVQFHDGSLLPARIVGADPSADVAVLKIDAKDLKPLPFADSDAVNVGQMVFAVGNPFGLSETVTQGIISAKGRRTSPEFTNEFFQTDAPINPGNSGGPLVDLRGQLVGLNNSILLQTDGIGFAIPSNTVRRIYEDIRRYGRVIRPWLGVQIGPLTPAVAAQLGLDSAKGALVAPIQGSPAARAGIQFGDIITSLNGRPIADDVDLRNRILETEPGAEIALGVRRNGKDLTIRVVVEKQSGE